MNINIKWAPILCNDSCQYLSNFQVTLWRTSLLYKLISKKKEIKERRCFVLMIFQMINFFKQHINMEWYQWFINGSKISKLQPYLKNLFYLNISYYIIINNIHVSRRIQEKRSFELIRGARRSQPKTFWSTRFWLGKFFF